MQIRAGVLSRLAATVPPHHELAVSAALDLFLEGRFDAAAAAFGDGPAGDLIALHALTAYTALLGTQVSAPGKFTSANLAVMASVMHPRSCMRGPCLVTLSVPGGIVWRCWSTR